MREDPEEAFFLDEEEPLLERLIPLKIYEGELLFPLPDGYDIFTLSMDGGLKSDLDWRRTLTLAEKIVEAGKKILWDFNLGLFKELHHPFSNQSQFLSLTLSMEHFCDSVWKSFKESTLGLCLYRGSGDFSTDFPWNQEESDNFEKRATDEAESYKKLLFCRDVALDYLTLLASRLPDSLPLFLFLDVTALETTEKELKVLNPAYYSPFHLFLKGATLPFQAFGWGEATPLGFSHSTPLTIPKKEESVIGLLVPSKRISSSLIEAADHLLRLNLCFRLIAEEKLTAEWDGLDYLLFTSLGLTEEERRKLKGFAAAGGILVTTEEKAGLPNEIGFDDFISNFLISKD